MIVLYVFSLLLQSVVLCQSFTVSSDTCPGKIITFTCVVDGTKAWAIAIPGGINGTCVYTSNVPSTALCGPGNRFMSSPTEGSSDPRNSTLSVELTNDLNGILVECRDVSVGDTLIDSHDICVVLESGVQSPQFTIADIQRSGENEGIVRVEWSEVMDGCNGPVSRYVLCVTPPTTSDDQSGSEECYNTSTTHYDLTVKTNTNYILTVRGVACGNIAGNNSEPVNLQVIDEISPNNISANYNNFTGVLESISVAHGGFSLDFMGEVTDLYAVVISLSPVYLSKPADIDDRVTSELSVTIPVPPDVIAEYRPTLTVNVPGAPTISLSSYPIASELNETDLLDREVVLVDINGSCSSIVTCLEGENCTVYCGSSADLDSLDMRSSSTSVSNDEDIDVRLPPTIDEEFHCIVSGSNSDGSPPLFRVRTLDFKTGCPVDELLSTDKDPVCVEKDGDCVCTLNSTDGRYGVMYNSTSVDSTAKLFTFNDYCINGSQTAETAETEMIRTCDINQQWIGDIDVQLIVTAIPDITPNSVITTLIAIGVIICFVIGVFGAVIVVVSVVRTPPMNEESSLTKSTGRIPIWFWVLFGAASVVTVTAIVMWIVVAVYLPSHGGVNNKLGIQRSSVASLCEDVANDDTRVIPVTISFILSVFVPILWFICLILNCLRIGVKSSDPKNDDDSGRGTTTAGVGTTTVGILSAVDYTSTGEGEDDKQYDVLNHPKPSSPTSLLSDTDPAYGKLGKTAPPPDAQHYGKLDHTGGHIKKAAVAPVGEEEYGKLDRKQMQPMEPGHYGKLDHSSNKTATLPSQIAAGQGEYGKLDRSQMEDPEHYGKLDHPGKKVASLPPGALPPTNEGYGKLDSNRDIEMNKVS